MKQAEKEQRLNELKAQLEEVRVEMTKTDGKASKCQKMGLNFQETYPEGYAAYMEANARYNAIETEIAETETIEVDEENENENPE